MEVAFTNIYNQNSWGKTHKNGPGSTVEMTEAIRRTLISVIKKYQIKSIVDAACGLYSWIDPVITNDMEYIGIDIVKKQIEDNLIANLKSDSKAPTKNLIFRYADLTKEYPDIARGKDLIFCKHLTQHLTADSTRKILNNFKSSGCKYLLITNYEISYNSDVCQWSSPECPKLDEGACRTQNLIIYPYSLTGLIEHYPKFALFKLGY